MQENARFVRGRLGFDTRPSHTQDLNYCICYFPVYHSAFWKEHGSEDGQPRTVAFTVLVQVCFPEANETEMSAPYLPRMMKEGTLTSLIPDFRKLVDLPLCVNNAVPVRCAYLRWTLR